MLEDAAENVKRYAPPPQRNRVLNRRKSGDRFEKINYAHGNDGEKNLPHARTFSVIDNGEVGNNKNQNENSHCGMIPLNGCSNSEAAQLLQELQEHWEDKKTSYTMLDCSGGWLLSLLACRFNGEMWGPSPKFFSLLIARNHQPGQAVLRQLVAEARTGWAAAMHSYNDPSVDLSERPVMYSGASGSSWGQLKLPHQMDFLAELRRAVHSSGANAGPPAGDRT